MPDFVKFYNVKFAAKEDDIVRSLEHTAVYGAPREKQMSKDEWNCGEQVTIFLN